MLSIIWGRHDEAIKAYDKTIELDLQAYIAAYDKAIKLDPKNATAWKNKADALDYLGRHDEAIKVMTRPLS
jgi:tetratricopeptide (TPR) repeat protein